MLASDVVTLCESNGVSELARMYGLSARQANAFLVQAQRLLNQGHNPVLTPGSDAATVRNYHKRTEEPEPEALSLEEQAQARARKINEQSYGQRSHDIGQLRGRVSTLRKNCERGYREWEHDLALTTRILEILEGTTV